MTCNEYTIANGDTVRLYSYVVKSDTGFAPNPFWNYCTVACCKPKIRKNANVGEWIVGTGSKHNVGQDKLIYAMKITEKITFEQYSEDRRFRNKIPRFGLINECGDNIYYKNNEGKWIQRYSYHNEKDIDHDLSGIYVLISDHYFYFGRNAILIQNKFTEIIKKGPSHKCNFDDNVVEEFLEWIENNYKTGIHGDPHDFEQKLNDIKKSC